MKRFTLFLLLIIASHTAVAARHMWFGEDPSYYFISDFDQIIFKNMAADARPAFITAVASTRNANSTVIDLEGISTHDLILNLVGAGGLTEVKLKNIKAQNIIIKAEKTKKLSVLYQGEIIVIGQIIKLVEPNVVIEETKGAATRVLETKNKKLSTNQIDALIGISIQEQIKLIELRTLKNPDFLFSKMPLGGWTGKFKRWARNDGTCTLNIGRYAEGLNIVINYQNSDLTYDETFEFSHYARNLQRAAQEFVTNHNLSGESQITHKKGGILSWVPVFGNGSTVIDGVEILNAQFDSKTKLPKTVVVTKTKYSNGKTLKPKTFTCVF